MTTPTSTTPTQTTTSQSKVVYSILVVIACAMGLAGLFAFSHMKSGASTGATSTTTAVSETALFPTVSLEARAAYVYDVRTGEALFSKNGDTMLPLASLTKILTALVAMRTIPTDEEVVVSQTALRTEGDSGLVADERWKLSDLASFMLVVSSNDAATALREAYENHTGGSFIAAMNNRAKTLGISATFVNEHGLDVGIGKESNSGSAHDIALLLSKALSEEPGIFDATRNESAVFTSISGIDHQSENTNELINDIPWALGAKTGFTDAAGGNLAVAFDRSVGHPVVIVVMGSSRDGRFADMKKLITATLERF